MSERSNGELGHGIDVLVERLTNASHAVAALEKLTEAKFVTYKALLDSNSEKVALALSAADKAVTKAEVATEKRFEAVNEFRAQLDSNQRAQASQTAALTAGFLAKDTYEAAHKSLVEKVDSLEGAVTRLLITLLTTIAGALMVALIAITFRN